ncbi:resolvase-like domain protein [Escherichia coli DEC5B]|nr:resolvase-like domain protein [Escherichia coli DEC5B]EHX12124.1 transposase for insertion sequence element IS640 [Escherichia coli DEC11E]EHX15861.1 transposase for insertion sequence element IS640 [Escherichia coli DEC11D]
MIKQMRQQGAYIVDIATQIGCSERTVRRYLKYPEPPARKTRHKMAEMDYIDMRLAENCQRRMKSDPLYQGLRCKDLNFFVYLMMLRKAMQSSLNR